MIQNIRITTGQILNFSSQVRAPGLSISLPIPNLSTPFISPFYYAFDGVEESYPLTGSESISISKMSDQSIRFNLRNQYVLTSTFSDFQNNTLPNIITTNDNQNASISSITNTIGSLLQISSFNNTINNYLSIPSFKTYSQFVSSLLTNIFNLDITQNSRLDSIESTFAGVTS